LRAAAKLRSTRKIIPHRLVSGNEPPADVDAFTDAVIRAEGLDPYADIPLNLRRDIWARVAKHFTNLAEL
jgi:hypothetical protein